MITNPDMADHSFLRRMYADGYFPEVCVDKVAAVLQRLCEQIEATKPADLGGLYEFTHAATEEINDLEEDFEEHGSEIETVARKLLAEEFVFIAKAYGVKSRVVV